jgi:hypothetical protein
MPAFVAKLSPEQWAEARRQRAEGASYVEIAARFGVTPGWIGQCARRQGWPSRGRTAGAKPARGKTRAPSPATADTRRQLVHRFYRILDLEGRMMELRMTKELDAHDNSDDPALPALPSEEHCRCFASLIERFKQVTEMDSEPASAANGGRKSINPELTALSDELDAAAIAAASEKDNLRRELAESLGALFQKS